MHDYSIELSGDSVTVSGPDGFLISDPTQGFIEFLYASNEEIDTILDLEKDKVDILYDNAASFQFLPFLIWGIYNIDNAAGLTNKKEEILKDLKQQQAYFYEKARIYLDENPPISEYKSLTPRERYVQNNDIGISARCNLSLDRFTLEPVEKYFPEKLEEVFYILFIRMVIRNSTIKRCGYCGKFFEKRPGYNNEYCNRTIPGKNKKCKDIGAVVRYNSQSKDDFQKTFERHYKKVSAYCRRKGLNKDFKIWLSAAREIKEHARSENMELELFNNKLTEIENDLIY